MSCVPDPLLILRELLLCWAHLQEIFCDGAANKLGIEKDVLQVPEAVRRYILLHMLGHHKRHHWLLIGGFCGLTLALAGAGALALGGWHRTAYLIVLAGLFCGATRALPRILDEQADDIACQVLGCEPVLAAQRWLHEAHGRYGRCFDEL